MSNKQKKSRETKQIYLFNAFRHIESLCWLVWPIPRAFENLVPFRAYCCSHHRRVNVEVKNEVKSQKSFDFTFDLSCQQCERSIWWMCCNVECNRKTTRRTLRLHTYSLKLDKGQVEREVESQMHLNRILTLTVTEHMEYWSSFSNHLTITTLPITWTSPVSSISTFLARYE